ncbi:hypothetical protein PG988_015498 [Apiospora saccharicola]
MSTPSLSFSDRATLCSMVSLALGSVVIRPDDPYAFLAAEATSYEDLASRVVAFVAASGEPHEPVPSPVVTPARQKEIDELVKSMRPGHFCYPTYHLTVKRRNGALAARHGKIECGGITAFAPDMVRCVNYLASLGQQECRIPSPWHHSEMCGDKSAHIIAASGAIDRAVPCATVAVEAGHIMDLCTTGGGQQIGGYGFFESDPYMEILLSGAPFESTS